MSRLGALYQTKYVPSDAFLTIKLEKTMSMFLSVNIFQLYRMVMHMSSYGANSQIDFSKEILWATSEWKGKNRTFFSFFKRIVPWVSFLCCTIISCLLIVRRHLPSALFQWRCTCHNTLSNGSGNVISRVYSTLAAVGYLTFQFDPISLNGAATFFRGYWQKNSKSCSRISSQNLLP